MSKVIKEMPSLYMNQVFIVNSCIVRQLCTRSSCGPIDLCARELLCTIFPPHDDCTKIYLNALKKKMHVFPFFGNKEEC